MASLKVTVPAGAASCSIAIPFLIRAGMWVVYAILLSGLFLRFILKLLNLVSLIWHQDWTSIYLSKFFNKAASIVVELLAI